MDRRPAVAGSFYPATKQELSDNLEQLFSNALPAESGDVCALVVPHAGYVFSGEVAASAYNQIDRNRVYKRVFLIGTAHRNSFAGASVYTAGNFEMPYGTEEVDCEVGNGLCNENPLLFSDNPAHHDGEHGLEVQLPFVNHVLRAGYKIVPIIIGDVTVAQCAEIANILEPWFNSENLFVVSTDFSHYPSYEDARILDNTTMEAIVGQSPVQLLKVLESNAGKGVKELYTSLCGWSSVLVLLHLTQNVWGFNYKPLQYKNSGDNSQYGSKDGVVGYWAIAVHDLESCIVEIAKRAIQSAVTKDFDKQPNFNLEEGIDGSAVALEVLAEYGFDKVPVVLEQASGVFVTLRKEGNLRGCIGYIQSEEPLYKDIANIATMAALNDSRFVPVSVQELPFLEYEVSVLSPMRLIDNVAEIEMGKHGVVIGKGSRSGLFLPQVATETGWTLEEFLGHCSRDKAGIGWDGWRDGARIWVFTVFKLPRGQIFPR
ncbi:MAG: AmmeMemoRadiSam system protein B [Bacteroidales bacterium]|jgi:AmmeMemoRadiSam system protein B/AmmeMemoRadiSam system protein A|nr:AmmeMemoRadiSam system protein B [Bacteroidales bacterium]